MKGDDSMRDDSAFQQMMNRYSRELISMQRRITPLQPQQTQPEQQEPAPTEAADQPAARDISPVLGEAGTQHSQTVGESGPVLMEDIVLHEVLQDFVHQKPRERVLHIKGYGALGQFELARSMAPYTTAAFLQTPGSKTPVIVRFSKAGGPQGAADSLRDIWGFAVRFYTTGGICDFVGNHIPVFFVQDAMRFPQVIAALSPSPQSNLTDPNRLWSFVADTPETLHMITYLFSDQGTVGSLRHIAGHSVNTFVWKNAQGERRYVKYHWKPLLGEEFLTQEQAAVLAGKNPQAAGEDLWNTLAQGTPVKYELQVQLMELSERLTLPFDPLDDTKTWDEQQFEPITVGTLVLQENPRDYSAQVEQLAFSPANLVPGIELSEDKMLQGRAFAYWDAQRYRLGNGFRRIAVNRQPGFSPFTSLVTSQEGVMLQGIAGRYENPRTQEYQQPAGRYAAMDEQQREHLALNLASSLGAADTGVQERVLGLFERISPRLSQAVREAMD